MRVALALLSCALLPLGLAGCEPTPSISVGPDDSGTSGSDGTTAVESNGHDGAASDDAAADASASEDSSHGSHDAGLEASSCLSPGDPQGAGCCPGGGKCFGVGCSHCDLCAGCTQWCCATEQGHSGKFSGTCAPDPSGCQ